jgi:exodeoxyribonuclease V alpha subunit
MPSDKCLPLYERLCAEGFFSPLDIEFAAFTSKFGNDSPLFRTYAALASRQSSERHLCVDLESLPEELAEVSDGCALPELEKELSASGAVGDGRALTPLVLDGSRLYLRRHYMNEIVISESIRERSASRIPCDERVVREGLAALFPDDGDIWQKCAALNALYRNFSVITGGPGTGKTTVVVRVLLLAIYEEYLRTGNVLSAAICAPTGKAAAHMFRSVSTALRTLESESAANPLIADILRSSVDAIPSEGTTIHRLLGGYGSRTEYHQGNPLPWDIVIVDECSMADAALFARLISSVRGSARVIILGDACQLSSVDAGSVMGDICDNGTGGPAYSNEYAACAKKIASAEVPEQMVKPDSPLLGTVTYLAKSRRFSSDSGIGALARMINDGDGKGALGILEAGGECGFIPVLSPEGIDPFTRRDFSERIRGILAEHYKKLYFDASPSPEDLISRLGSFQILCAARRGYLGCEYMNGFAEEFILGEGFLRGGGHVYHGLPLIVTENDHAMKLYNGDTGVLCDSGTGQVRAYFESTGGELRGVLPLQIMSWEKAYALTVHKSQGSEYDHVLVFIPRNDSALLSRELLYTAVTRAKKSVTIVSAEDVFLSACGRRTRRDSGLNGRLWK